MEMSGFILLVTRLDELIISLLDGAPLTEERMYQLCEECLQTKVRQPLIRALGEAFTTPAILARSFASKVVDSNEAIPGKSSGKLFIFISFLHIWFGSVVIVSRLKL